MILNTPPQDGAYRSYAPSLLHMYLIRESAPDRVCFGEGPLRRGSVGEGPLRRGSVEAGLTKKIRQRRFDGEGSSEKVRQRRYAGEGPLKKFHRKKSDREDPPKKVHWRRFAEKGPSEKMAVGKGMREKVRWRRSDGEGSMDGEGPSEKVCWRRWMPKKRAHSRTNHGSDTM